MICVELECVSVPIPESMLQPFRAIATVMKLIDWKQSERMHKYLLEAGGMVSLFDQCKRAVQAAVSGLDVQQAIKENALAEWLSLPDDMVKAKIIAAANSAPPLDHFFAAPQSRKPKPC